MLFLSVLAAQKLIGRTIFLAVVGHRLQIVDDRGVACHHLFENLPLRNVKLGQLASELPAPGAEVLADGLDAAERARTVR